MADPLVSMRVKSMFFDRPKVRRAMDAGTHRALSKAGAFIRTRARSSMRTRKGASAPGRPPHAHFGSLKRLLFFAYDRDRKSVVVGPVKYRKGVAPALNEYGGKIRVRNHMIRIPAKQKGKKRAKGVRFARGAGSKVIRVTGLLRYPQRPFMRPALEAEMQNIPPAFRNVIRGG